MKTHTFIGADSSQAMRKVKQTLGNDVALLSCRRVNGGVEIVVGVEQSVKPRAVPTQPAERARHQLQQELTRTRAGLENAAKGSEWVSERAKNPSAHRCLDILKALDIEPRIASALINRIPDSETPEVQQALLHNLLRQAVRTLPTPGEGVSALVGPPGVGKTTTIAKIAADFVRRGRRDEVAMITTDTNRIAAEEQLRIYGNIFRIPVHAASTAQEAAELIHMLSHKKYVLLDTEGVSIRDQSGVDKLHELFSVLPDLDVFLTLPADREHHLLNEMVTRFKPLPLTGAIATNLDQSLRLGALLSVLIQHRLPVVWFTDGGKVPDNLCKAESKVLVAEAFRLAREFKRGQESSGREVYTRKGVVA